MSAFDAGLSWSDRSLHRLPDRVTVLSLSLGDGGGAPARPIESQAGDTRRPHTVMSVVLQRRSTSAAHSVPSSVAPRVEALSRSRESVHRESPAVAKTT